MNRSSLVFAFAACVCLVLVGLWQLSRPKEHARVLKPAEADIFAEGQTPTGNPLEGESRPQLDDYVPPVKKLAPPPPPPQVDNDLASGRIWLRLLDSRNNQPVGDTSCNLIRLELHGTYQYEMERTGGRRVTDTDGLVSFSSFVIEDGNSEVDPGAWDFIFDWEFVRQFHVPVPSGWQPAIGAYEIAEQLESLISARRSIPVDVLVTPEADLRIVARDEWGQPVADAMVQNYWIYADLPTESWLSLIGADSLLFAESWLDLTTTLEHVSQSSAATASFGGVSFPSNYQMDGSSLHLNGAESPIGTIVLRGLPCVRVGAAAFRKGIGFGHATIDLQPGHNELNVYLKAPPTCTLNVRIEWLGEPLGADEAPKLELETEGPFGASSFVGESNTDCTLEWSLEPNGGTVWEGQVRNLPAGFWEVDAMFSTVHSNWVNSAWIHLLPGDVGSVTIYCGEGSTAYWTPLISLQGKQLERCSIRMLGGHRKGPLVETIEHNRETRETTELELPAGTYTVWIPTQKPVQVILQPGERRTDAFSLLCASVQFSIDAPLAELLSNEGGNVQLNLFPSDEWDSAEEHLIEIDAAMRAGDEEYDQLRPAVVRVWTVPLGRYRWQLVGADQLIEGHLALNHLSESVHFGLRSLPGYELCQLDFTGLDPQSTDLDFTGDGTASLAAFAFKAAGYESVDYTHNLDALLPDYLQFLYATDTVYAYGPRGTFRLTVDDGQPIRAAFPGRLVITPGHTSGAPAGALHFAGNEEFQWHISAFHEDGSYDAFAVDDQLTMAPGWVTLMVSRRAGGDFEFARVQVKLTAEEQTLDLDTLDFEAYATVTLVFRGRGSPESPFDAWWYGGEAPAPLVLALDQSFGGAPRYVGLGTADKVLPDGRLEFSYDDRMLPPGRYKVIPWKNAPEKYCKTFTLTPGSRSTIVIEGG